MGLMGAEEKRAPVETASYTSCVNALCNRWAHNCISWSPRVRVSFSANNIPRENEIIMTMRMTIHWYTIKFRYSCELTTTYG